MRYVRMRMWIILVILIASRSSSHALPALRDGANHRLGDDSFVARFGRSPGPGDSEALRMATHLEYVHAWLSARPATRRTYEGIEDVYARPRKLTQAEREALYGKPSATMAH